MTIRPIMVLLLAFASLTDTNLAADAEMKKWALVIGIRGYPRFQDKLSFSDNDAKSFYDFGSPAEFVGREG